MLIERLCIIDEWHRQQCVSAYRSPFPVATQTLEAAAAEKRIVQVNAHKLRHVSTADCALLS